MTSQLREADVLENIVPQLEAEGFEVYSQPSANLVPSFMQSYRPDAIAIREDKKLAIEVVRKETATQKRLDKIRELLAGHRDWELRVYWISPANVPELIEVASGRDIQQAIKGVEELADKGVHGAALLMAWATFEALGRALLPQKFARPQTPGRLIETLAGEGYITPSEADRLRDLAKVRNRLAHGGLRAKIATRDIKSFAAILRTLQKLHEDA